MLKIDEADLEEIYRQALRLMRAINADEEAGQVGKRLRDICEKIASQNDKHFT